MVSRDSRSGKGFLPLVVKGYIFGTLVSAVVLHIAIAVVAPGDGGTVLALGSGPILFVLLMVLGLVGLVVFPVAALASWPFRGLVFERPLLGAFIAIAVGVGVGAVLTATEFQIGPKDFWSGPLVGSVYGLVWFWVVRASFRSEADRVVP